MNIHSVIEASYEAFPYDSNPFVESHPDRLASVATLYGMKPPDVQHSRVLELGCADGCNLLPMAIGLRDSQFLGIDLSPRQIEMATAMRDQIGLSNIEFRRASILDLDSSLGTFDYIICHGVFSWVPTEVQEKILAICAEQLAPNGVAYVSYNIDPGWHTWRVIRDLMLWHGRRFPDLTQQVQQARIYLDFLARSAPTDASPNYASMLQHAAKMIGEKTDGYLIHEYLEEVNEPIYFYQFASRIHAKGLQYIADTNLTSLTINQFPADIQNILRQLSPDIIDLEQHLDFLQNRVFRRSLLCRQSVALERTIKPEALTNLFVTSLATPVSKEPNLGSATDEWFQLPNGKSFSSAEPLVKAALVRLSDICPQCLPFTDLCKQARERLDGQVADEPAASDRETLSTRLLQYYISEIIELHAYVPAFVTQVQDKPIVSPLVRRQAERGPRVTNLRQEIVNLSETARRVSLRLDGTCDRAELFDMLFRQASTGQMHLEKEGRPVTGDAAIREMLTIHIDDTLNSLARTACLVG